MVELAAERDAAAAGIRAVGSTPVMFEQFGGRDADPEDAYLGEVETSDIYIGILGRHYGKPLRTRYSATHAEFLHAEESGLRIAVWCLKAEDREGHEQSFLEEVRAFHVVPAFSTPDDLGTQVEERLKAIAAEDLAPWCKLGNIVFRASEVADHGAELRVTARVRSDEVIHALERLRGERGLRGDDARFTWGGRSRFVRVASLTTTTTAARSKTVVLTLEAREEPRDHLIEMSVNGRSPADLTEAALRSALFGERNPLEDQHMGFMAEIVDWVAAIVEAGGYIDSGQAHIQAPIPTVPNVNARVLGSVERPLSEVRTGQNVSPTEMMECPVLAMSVVRRPERQPLERVPSRVNVLISPLKAHNQPPALRSAQFREFTSRHRREMPERLRFLETTESILRSEAHRETR
jgi:hypothetical protein